MVKLAEGARGLYLLWCRKKLLFLLFVKEQPVFFRSSQLGAECCCIPSLATPLPGAAPDCFYADAPSSTWFSFRSDARLRSDPGHGGHSRLPEIRWVVSGYIEPPNG